MIAIDYLQCNQSEHSAPTPSIIAGISAVSSGTDSITGNQMADGFKDFGVHTVVSTFQVQLKASVLVKISGS